MRFFKRFFLYIIFLYLFLFLLSGSPTRSRRRIVVRSMSTACRPTVKMAVASVVRGAAVGVGVGVRARRICRVTAALRVRARSGDGVLAHFIFFMKRFY
jgi:hypothetical protein